VEAVGTTLGSATLAATATLRTNLSIHHFLGAARFSRQVAEIEQVNAKQPFGEFFEEILWFGSACVLSCVAGLEAYANELFVDRSEHFPDVRAEIADKLWELFEQKPLLEKFDMALLLKQRPLLDRAAPPTQDVAALIALRNGLTHFKPEWDNQQKAHARIAQQLAGRFEPSAFLPNTEAVFPRRWASHGCTRWAVRSSFLFVEEFETRTGVPARIVKFRDRLMTR
jgi:hypothetical protein